MNKDDIYYYDELIDQLVFEGCSGCKEIGCEYRDDCTEDCIPYLIQTIKQNFNDESITLLQVVRDDLNEIYKGTGLLSFQRAIEELGWIDFFYNKG